MNKRSTHFFFQYTYFAGKSYSSLLKADLTFEYSNWLKTKIDELIDKTPEVPDRLIDKILLKANVY